MTEATEVGYKITGMRQLARGFEVEVVLGSEGVPSGHLKTTILLQGVDKEWAALRDQIHALAGRRAVEAIESMVEWAKDHPRELRAGAKKKVAA